MFVTPPPSEKTGYATTYVLVINVLLFGAAVHQSDSRQAARLAAAAGGERTPNQAGFDRA